MVTNDNNFSFDTNSKGWGVGGEDQSNIKLVPQTLVVSARCPGLEIRFSS